MAFFKGVIRSNTLSMDTGICVILPHDRPFEKNPKPAKVLYLLHGLGDNCEAWTRYTNIERYAREYRLAVIMPEVQRGFYLNMEHGLKYFDYVAQELPVLCSQMFGISTKREDSFIAGLSMGGYGAMKCGLTFPGKYAGCASFSGALDIDVVISEHLTEENKNELQGAFGMELRIKPSDNLFCLAEKAATINPVEKPKIFISCGTEDFLYKSNVKFKGYLDNLGVAHKYTEWPGEHEWGFWDKSIRYALEFFLSPADGQ